MSDALAQARRVLQQRPSDAGGLVVAGLSLIGLDRLDAARRHLDEARTVAPARADVHYGLALWHRASTQGAEGAEVAVLRAAADTAEESCRLAPDAWEPHALLSMLLWGLVQQQGGPARAPDIGDRSLQRSMYHAVRALEMSPPPSEMPALLYHLGITCMHTRRFEDANRVLSRLLPDQDHRAKAEYYLGLVHYQMGHFKNAVMYLRKHLRHAPSTARVHARIGMAYLELGELGKAQESLQQAIAIDPGDLQSRWTLGCALLEEGHEADALRTFKSILADAPDHTLAFRELARAHARRHELEWLNDALRSEVEAFDGVGAEPGPSGVSPRQATSERIGALLAAMVEAAGSAAVPELLRSLDLTRDEGLRMRMWEAGLDALQQERAEHVGHQLAYAGEHYAADVGRQVLTLATSLPPELLLGGLQIQEEDLQRAAVERQGPARDVVEHRKAIDRERREARAWQALLLLALATQGQPEHKPMLERWAAEADDDLADAARAALVMFGDGDATDALRRRARAYGAQNLVDAMVAQVKAPEIRTPVRAAVPDEARVCASCGRYAEDVEVMLVGGTLSMCSVCLEEVSRQRDSLRLDDPERNCALSGRGTFETEEMYLYRGVAVCAEVVEHGLSLIEQRAVDRFLKANL